MKPKPMPFVIEYVNGMTTIDQRGREADREVVEVDPGELVCRAPGSAMSSASVSELIIR